MDITELKKSPMFNLSLSSKELFHSNFLAWIAEDEETKNLFMSILKLFGLDNSTAEDYADGIRGDKPRYIVKREYNNFDFCICENLDNWENYLKEAAEDKIPGRVLFVLENKFKSISYKAQLEEYQTKVVELNEQASANEAKLSCCKNDIMNNKPNGNTKIYQKHKKVFDSKHNDPKCHFVLLSLAKEVCGFSIEDKNTHKYIQTDNNEKWHFVTYMEYSNILMEHTKAQLGFKYELISDYANYIYKFCEYLDNNIPQNILQNSWTSMLSSRSDLIAIRMDDIWQKIIVNHIAKEFCNMSNFDYVFGKSANEFIDDQELNGKVYVQTGFSRGTGILDIKIKIDNDCLFGIQMQNGYYKRLLETTKNRLIPTTEGFYKKRLQILQGMYNFEQKKWKNPTEYIIFENDEVHPTRSRAKRVLERFGGYGQTFIYQSKKLSSGCTIEMVLKTIIADINSVCKLCNLTKVRRM